VARPGGRRDNRSMSADEAVDPGFTIFDETVGARGRALDVPRLVGSAVSILHRAAGRDLTIVIALQVLSGVILAVEVLAGRDVLQGLLDADRTNGSISDFAVPLVALGVAGLLAGVVNAVMRHEQHLLGELTARYVQSRLHDVACAVELEELERPAFHDRLARAQQSLWRPVNLVFALAALASAVVSLCAMLITIAAIEPWLLGLVVLAVVPRCWPRRARATRTTSSRAG
jgi:ATP-binding cassette, subfamily B, bacterial